MSILRPEHILNLLEHKKEPELRAILVALVKSTKISPAMKSTLYRLVAGMDSNNNDKRPVAISPDRFVKYNELVGLWRSGMVDFTNALIEAALDPQGPHNTKELMLVAGALAGGAPYFMKPDGFEQQDMKHAGFILTMAGFERKSVYKKELGMPLKCWVKRRGYANLGVREREQLVMSIMKYELFNEGEAPKKEPSVHAPTSLESLV